MAKRQGKTSMEKIALILQYVFLAVSICGLLYGSLSDEAQSTPYQSRSLPHFDYFFLIQAKYGPVYQIARKAYSLDDAARVAIDIQKYREVLVLGFSADQFNAPFEYTSKPCRQYSPLISSQYLGKAN